MRRWGPLVAITAALALATTACAPALAKLPAGPGTSSAEALTAYGQATAACRDVQTMAAVLAISGRAGRSRFRAKVDAGFATPARVRLELPAPGKPFFTFVADGDQATLVLPRDGRVLRNAAPAATLEALAGIALEPDVLRSLVTGCGFATGEPTAGRLFDRGWAAVDVGGGTAWLQQVAGAWRVTAAVRGPIEVRYADVAAGRPATIRLRTSPGSPDQAADLTIRLSQVDLNQTLAPTVFQVEIPAGATAMTLDELRQSGPLGR